MDYGKLVKKAKYSSKSPKIVYFQDFTKLKYFLLTLANSISSASLLGIAFFSTFAAIMTDGLKKRLALCESFYVYWL